MSINLSDYSESTASKKRGASSKNSSPSKGIMDFLNKDIQLTSGFGDKKKETFYGDLNSLLRTGIDLTSSLELLKDEQKKRKDREVYGKVLHSIVSGSGFHEALQKTGKFSDYEVSSIRIGEQSGKLTEVLEQLQSYFTSKIKLKRQMVSAFTYPVFILAVAVGVVCFMLTSVVPMFQDVFSQFDQELPALTQSVVYASHAVQASAPYVVVGVLICAAVLYTQRRTTWFRSSLSWIILRIPFFGPVIRKVYTARFCQFMYLLTSSRTPLIEAVELMKGVIGLYPMERSMDDIGIELRRGGSLNSALSKHPVYDSRLVTMVKVSEETNKLDDTFQKLSEQYSKDVEYRMSVLSTLLEPVIIIAVGLFIGVIVLSMYLPMFELTSTFQ